MAGVLSGTPTVVIGREELIRNKLAAGRPQDKLDVNVLRRANEGKADNPRSHRPSRRPRKGPRRRSP